MQEVIEFDHLPIIGKGQVQMSKSQEEDRSFMRSRLKENMQELVN